MERKGVRGKNLVVFIRFCLFSVLVTGFLAVNATTVNSQQAVQDASSTDELIIRYKTLTPENEKEKMRKNLRTSLKHRIQRLNVEVLKIQEGTIEEKIRQYKKNPNVAYAEPNYKAYALGVTNDALLSKQWGLFKISAVNTQISAWDITTGSPSIKLAVLDTGIEISHDDLFGKVILSSNFTDSPTVTDVFGHGTHVAGIAAAATNNSIGIAGAGYNTSILNGKVLGDDGSGYYSWVVNGIVWAADQGAQVINLSLGGASSSNVLQDAVNYAWSKGSVVVAAAGNTGNTRPQYPGYYQNVIAVAATDSNDKKASFSTYGNWVDVAAPGVNIYSTYKGNSYNSLSGTSMSTPFASGVSALIWARGICETNTCVREQLEKTTDKISGTGKYWTWGRINAYKAVSGAGPFSTPIPTPTPTINIIPTPSNTPIPIATATPTPVLSDAIKPTVSITYPVNGSTVSRKNNIEVTANADDDTGVARVVFYRNNNQICSIAGPTMDKIYSCSMYTVSTRTKVKYKATAFDVAGNSSSSSVTVTAK